MMTKSKSGTWAKSKMLIALPALAALLFLLPASSVSSSSDSGNPDKTQTAPLLVKAPAVVPSVAGEVQEPQDKEKKKTEAKYVPGQPDKNGVYPVVEQQPEYTGGDEARIKFMVENIKYPEEAKKAGIQGKVFVTFVIQADGAVTDVKVLRGIGGGCDEEAVRVVKMMPNWIPGKEQGKNVAVQFNLPIKFRLDSDKKDKPKK